MISGEDSPELLSWKVRGKLRKKEKQVKESLKGCFNEFHRMISITSFSASRRQDLEPEVARRMEPYAKQIAGLVTIPGVERIVAWRLIAELGADMSVFPDAPESRTSRCSLNSRTRHTRSVTRCC